MKYVQQSLQSGAFLLTGLVVLAASLHFSNVRQTMANDSAGSKAIPAPAFWFDKSMPGSVPYLVQRVEDRWNLINHDATKRLPMYLHFVHSRLDAAEYSFLHGQEDTALRTLNKALGYLSAAQNSCFLNATEEFSCNQLSPLFSDAVSRTATVSQKFATDTENPALKSQAERILQQSQSML